MNVRTPFGCHFLSNHHSNEYILLIIYQLFLKFVISLLIFIWDSMWPWPGLYSLFNQGGSWTSNPPASTSQMLRLWVIRLACVRLGFNFWFQYTVALFIYGAQCDISIHVWHVMIISVISDTYNSLVFRTYGVLSNGYFNYAKASPPWTEQPVCLNILPTVPFSSNTSLPIVFNPPSIGPCFYLHWSYQGHYLSFLMLNPMDTFLSLSFLTTNYWTLLALHYLELIPHLWLQ